MFGVILRSDRQSHRYQPPHLADLKLWLFIIKRFLWKTCSCVYAPTHSLHVKWSPWKDRREAISVVTAEPARLRLFDDLLSPVSLFYIHATSCICIGAMKYRCCFGGRRWAFSVAWKGRERETGGGYFQSPFTDSSAIWLLATAGDWEESVSEAREALLGRVEMEGAEREK